MGGGKFLTLTSNEFFSKMLLLVAAFFLLSSASAFADGTDDFSTITAANTYGTYTSTAGWTATNAQVLDEIDDSSITGTDVSTSTHAIVINGKTTSVGTITSPTLSDGCSTLSLNYTNVYAESNGVKFQVDIVQNENTVATYTVENTSVTQFTTYTWEQKEIGVSGDFSIKITNLSPSSSSKNKDRVAIWNIAWTSSGGSTTTKSAAGLAFSQTSYSIEQGVDEFTAPTFSKSTTADVTFSSNNKEVATVSTDGKISLAGGLGKAIITASSEANDDYYAGSATCTIEVFTYNVYKKATSISSGKSYLIGAVLTDRTAFYAYPITSNYGYLKGTTSESSEEIKIKNSYDDTFLFTYDETNGWTIKQNTNSKYLYQTSTYNNFNVAASPTEGQYWTVSSNDDGTVTITNQSTSKYIQYSPSYTSFGCYTDAQTDAVLPTLYELVTKKFEFSAETATATVEDDFTEPTLTNEYGTTATYSSSNTSVATVDESTGDVTIVAAGETTITATDGTNTASYTLTVKEAAKLTGDGTFENPYTVADMQLLYSNGDYTSITDNVWVKGYIVGSFANGSASNFSTGSDGTTASNMALADDANAESYERTDLVAVQLSSNTNVRSVANLVDNTDNVGKEVIVYGSISKEYTSGAGVKSTSKIYGLRSIEIKTAEGYATYYNDCAYEMPTGVQGTTVAYNAESNSLTMSWGYEAGKTVPNGSALLLSNNGKGKQTYNLVVTNSSASAAETNHLHGSTTAVTPTDDGYYYKLAYENENLENLGWYYGAADGAAFESAANLCYLMIPKSSTTSAAAQLGFYINGISTSISAVTTNESATAQPIYNIYGKRISNSIKNLPAGLYIVGGKKVIVK